MGWPKFDSHKTTIKQRAAARAAAAAQRKAEADRRAQEARAACEKIKATALGGGPANPEWQAWAEDRVNRRWGLRMGSMSW